MNIILKGKLKTNTKDTQKMLYTIIVAFVAISIALIIKYKPAYLVKMADKELGYIENKYDFDKNINNKIIELNGKNAEIVTLNDEITYELKLIDRNEQIKEDEVLVAINNNSTVTYKYYAVSLNNSVQEYVDSFDEATALVEKIKEKYENEIDLDITVSEKYVENNEEITIDSIECAENNIETGIEAYIEENGMVRINGVLLSTMPINNSAKYFISSRYGEVSKIRSSAHTGLDLACPTGTSIYAVANGTVIEAKNHGGYGNLVKIDHGNGLQTWYAHCSKIYVSEGQVIQAGDVIAAVGSTGNSTGPHLHFEIRINGSAVNPQKYVYNK